MLTILQDRLLIGGKQIELATAEGYEVMVPRRATCKLAAVLIAQGHSEDEPVRIVRADPYLFGPPHKVEGVTLGTTAAIDFFEDDELTPEADEAMYTIENRAQRS